MSSEVVKNNQDIALCPFRALMEYRTRSNEYRSPSQRALFIAVNKKHSTDITRVTLSRWLKTLIRRAYLDLHQEGMLKSATPIFPPEKNESSRHKGLGSYYGIQIYCPIEGHESSIVMLTYHLHQVLSQRCHNEI